MSTSNDPPRILAESQDFLHDALAAAKNELPSPSTLSALQAKIALATASSAGTGAAAATVAAKGALWLKAGLVVAALAAAGVTAAVVATPKNEGRAPVSVQTAPSEPAATPPVPAVATEEASAEAPRPVPSSSSATPTQVAPTIKAQAADLAEETRLLTDAQGALGANPAEALRLCDAHRKKFSAGILSQERDAVVVEALVKLGRKPEAKRAAAAFARSYPGSSHLRRISDLVAD